jgi:hypothetical protein
MIFTVTALCIALYNPITAWDSFFEAWYRPSDFPISRCAAADAQSVSPR